MVLRIIYRMTRTLYAHSCIIAQSETPFLPALKGGASWRSFVKPIGGDKFLAQASGVISESSVDKYQPGADIWVKMDPSDKTRVALYRS